MSVCSKYYLLCFCQILSELVYSWESYHKNKKDELFIETRCICVVFLEELTLSRTLRYPCLSSVICTASLVFIPIHAVISQIKFFSLCFNFSSINIFLYNVLFQTTVFSHNKTTLA